MRHLFRLLAVIALWALPAHALQKPAASPVPHAADRARVEAYLSGISTITADFSQVDAGGNVVTGKFYLKRPGKMRWQYQPPTPILLVSDGSVLIYYDSELQQVSYVGIDDTLAAFLARPHISLNSASTKLTRFSSGNGVIRATVVQAKKPEEGSLTLEFSDAPLRLRQMVVTDAAGNNTRIQLQNAVFGAPLADTLFIFEDPRGSTGGRGKR